MIATLRIGTDILRASLPGRVGRQWRIRAGNMGEHDPFPRRIRQSWGRSMTPRGLHSHDMLSQVEILEALPSQLETPTPSWEEDHGLTDAAVLAPIRMRDGQAELIFTVRQGALRHHAGEVSFPGGRRELGEEPVDCALREFEEEVGVTASALRVLGSLPPRTSIARYRVCPMVGFLSGSVDGDGDAELRFTPEVGEVAEILSAPVRELADRTRWGMRDVDSQRGKRFSVPFFDLGGHMLWGLTARFTLDLVDRMRSATP